MTGRKSLVPLFMLSKDRREQETNNEIYHELEVDVLARTLWGEARGEGEEGMKAVAGVIINRLKISDAFGQYWWGNTALQICQKPFQFSCWNKDDANYRKLLQVNDKDIYFATALRIARRALANILPDITGGATHYHAAQILPKWAAGKKATARIGNHYFYNLLDTGDKP